MAAACPFCGGPWPTPSHPQYFVDAVSAQTPPAPNYNLRDAVEFSVRNAPGVFGAITVVVAFLRGFFSAWKKPTAAMVILLAALMSYGCAFAASAGWPWKPTPTVPAPVVTPTPGTNPTPSPVATPTPAPTPDPGPAAKCPAEAPPLAEIVVKIYKLGRLVGDATPRVRDQSWCAAQGRPEQRACPFWKDESDIRLACERERALPLTWTLNGVECVGIDRGCWPHDSGPTKVFAALSARGTLRACAPGGAICGEAEIP